LTKWLRGPDEMASRDPAMNLSCSLALRSEDPSRKHVKLRTAVAISHNWDHTPCSFFYCLFVPPT